MNEARDALIARVALLREPEFNVALKAGDVNAAWKLGEDWVSALEAAPDVPVKCPCCTKLVTLCTKHYQLHEPGKSCVTCRKETS